ncbi:MAG: porin family protein [Chitinophagales bacterium]
MKKMIFSILLVLPCCVFAQFGVKAGMNFANVTKTSEINNSSQSGFNIGLLLAPAAKGIIGSRTELVYSKQGYDYKTSTNTGNVNLHYIMLPQYMTINITKFFQIQLGGQMGYLINANVDSSNTTSTGNPMVDQMMSYYNRFDFGYGGGIEIHPVSGLLIGARLNISLTSLYKDFATPPSGSGEPPSFIPKVDVKNNLFQIFAGWTFGKKSSKKK